LFIWFVIHMDLKPRTPPFHGGKNAALSAFLAACFAKKAACEAQSASKRV
jgi:hypothetical protein